MRSFAELKVRLVTWLSGLLGKPSIAGAAPSSEADSTGSSLELPSESPVPSKPTVAMNPSLLDIPQGWVSQVTPSFVQAAVGASVARAESAARPLALATHLYDITTPRRIAYFLAQIGHETGSFRYPQEIWGPTAQQKRYERDPSQPWDAKNERNKLAFALGNSEVGDGSRYRGRGWIQTTGRSNHRAVTKRLRERLSSVLYVPDFEANPELLTDPWWSALSAADYWEMRGINAIADSKNFKAVTKAINGGLTGYDDRVARLQVATAAVARFGLDL